MTSRWSRRPEGATWGDFGADDQCGRLNLLTREKVLEGIAEVREGRAFCLSLPLDMPGGNAVNPKRMGPTFGPVFTNGKRYYNYVWANDLPGNTDVTNDESITLYPQYSTQWDSLAHVGQLFDADERGELVPTYYNGYRGFDHIGTPGEEGEIGARALGIENMAKTCVQGRAVVVDLHAHFGEERVAVGYDRLAQILAHDGIEIESGDMFLFHTGWDDLIMSMGGNPDAERLHQACAVLDGYDERLLNWISDSGISIIATDNMAVEDSRSEGETQGGRSRLPLHRHCLFRLGVHLGELWYLSELTKALTDAGRSRCLLTAPPLRMPGAVGSPVTPVATI